MFTDPVKDLIAALPEAVAISDFGTDNGEPVYQIKAGNGPDVISIEADLTKKPTAKPANYLVGFIAFGLMESDIDLTTYYDETRNRATIVVDSSDPDFADKSQEALPYIRQMRRVYELAVEPSSEKWEDEQDVANVDWDLQPPFFHSDKENGLDIDTAQISFALYDSRFMGKYRKDGVIPAEMMGFISRLKTALVNVGIPPQEIQIITRCNANPDHGEDEDRFIYFFDFEFPTERLLNLEPGQHHWRMRTAQEEKEATRQRPSSLEL